MFKKSLISLCLFLAAHGFSWSAPSESCQGPKPLRLALSPIKDPAARYAQYRPLIHRLEKMLNRRVEIVPASSYGSAIESLLAAGIDLAELGPASYAIAMKRGADIVPFATFSMQQGPHTESSASYRSLLIAHRDKGASQLEQLRGATLALTDPASTSGAILPRELIRQRTGMPVEKFFKQVVFSGSHDRAIDAVKSKRVDAAFIASGRLDEALRQGRINADDYVVVLSSNSIPYDPFVMRQRLCPALAAKIRQVFLGDTSELNGMFAELHMTGFVPANDADYREIKALLSNSP